jgi:hypothetical protein
LLKLLHKSHTGQIKTYKNAREMYHWPGMKNEIAMMVDQCGPCQALRPSLPKEPLQPGAAAEPMAEMGVDLFAFKGQDWLVMVDRFSGFPFTVRLKSTTTDAVLTALMNWFHEWGYPRVIRTDGGPQFRGKFDEFCGLKSVIHELSSPYNPASNGLAEAAVKQVKYLLTKCDVNGESFPAALMEWRNVPRADGPSPAQAFLGRRQRTMLPTIGPQMCVDFSALQERKTNQIGKMRNQFDATAHPLSSFQEGDKVLMQHPVSKRWLQSAVITSCHEDGRSYNLLTEDGGETRRNRRFLRKWSSPEDTDDEECADTVADDRAPASRPAPAEPGPAPRRSSRNKVK